MADLEAEYQKRKIVYDNLVQDAVNRNDDSQITAIAGAKRAMGDSLSKMLEVSARSGTEDQQEELVRRLMEIQHDYNGLLVATDKLETLRRIHQSIDAKQGTGLKLFGLLFAVTSLTLIFMAVRTR